MAAHQAPPSLGFSRQEYWRGLPFPSPIIFIYCMKNKVYFILVLFPKTVIPIPIVHFPISLLICDAFLRHKRSMCIHTCEWASGHYSLNRSTFCLSLNPSILLITVYLNHLGGKLFPLLFSFS